MTEQSTHTHTDTDPETEDAPADEGTTESVDPNGSAEDAAAEEDGGPGRKGNSEAAKWRIRYREAEAERDQLRDRLTTMQRTEAARLATGPGRLVDGDDVFRTAELADLLDDEGTLDPAKVTATVDALVTAKPHLASPAFGDGVGVGERSPINGTTWASVIKG